MGEPATTLEVLDPGRCGAPTKSGGRCRRRTSDGGYCPDHRDDAVESGLPSPPAHLSEAGRGCWNHYLRRAAERGKLEGLDLTLVELAAELYELRRLAHGEMMANGLTLETKDGSRKKNPVTGKYTEWVREYRQVEKRFRALIGDDAPEPEPETAAAGPGSFL